MGSMMELPLAPSRSRSLSWRTGPFLCVAGAMTILLGCLLPHSRIHADNRPYGGTLQSVTYDGFQSVLRAVILLAVLAPSSLRCHSVRVADCAPVGGS